MACSDKHLVKMLQKRLLQNIGLVHVCASMHKSTLSLISNINKYTKTIFTIAEERSDKLLTKSASSCVLGLLLPSLFLSIFNASFACLHSKKKKKTILEKEKTSMKLSSNSKLGNPNCWHFYIDI